MIPIPSADIAPAGASRSRVRVSLVSSTFGRRQFVRLASAGGIALGMSAVGLLPKFARVAHAEPETHNHCDDYSSWDNGYWGACNPLASSGTVKIDNFYCNNGTPRYHRIDTVFEGHGIVTDYFRRHGSCKNKNTWIWRIKQGNNPPNYRDRRCSDGRYRTEKDGVLDSAGPTVCQDLLPETATESGQNITPDP